MIDSDIGRHDEGNRESVLINKSRRLRLIKFIVVFGSVLATIIVLEGVARLAVFLRYHGNYYTVTSLDYQTFLVTRSNNRFLQQYPAKGDQFRVLILGGSTADHLSYVPQEVFSKVFAKITSKRIEVINFGQAGHLSSQEAVMFALYGVHVEPDLVLVLDGANDIIDMTKAMPPGVPYPDATVQMAVNHPVSNAFMFPLRYSMFMNVLMKLKERSAETAFQSDERALNQMVDRYFRNRAAMAALANGVGARFVGVLQPYIYLRKTLTEKEKSIPLIANYTYRKEFMNNTFRRLSSESAQQQLGTNAIFVDSTSAFDDSTEDYFYDELHFANNKAREVLLKFIVDKTTAATKSASEAESDSL